MTKFSSLLLLTITLTSCGQRTSEKDNRLTKLTKEKVDSSLIAILPFDTTQYWIFKNSKQTVLASKDLINIETLLNKCIDEYNPKQEKQFNEINSKRPEYKLDKKNFIINLNRYKR